MGGREAKKKILEALLALLNEKPWGEITLADICQRADVVKSTFYYHFPSKEAVLTDHYDDGVQQACARLPEILLMDTGPAEKLLEIWRVYFATVATYDVEVLRQVLFLTARSEDMSLFYRDTEEAKRLGEVMEQLLAKAQTVGQIPKLAAPARYMYLVAQLTNGITVCYCSTGGQMDLATEAVRSIGLLLGIKE